MSDIVYPAGCKPVTEDLGPDELIRRLKVLTVTMQTMSQEEHNHEAYLPLALHLADEFFMQHPSRDVQLLTVCCIADVLRVYAPEAPYKDIGQVKCIFNFIIQQLGGLRDPKDTAFKRYFYLLENLAYVKSFNMCFDIEDSQDIFCNLFGLLFRIVNDEHSPKVKGLMLDVLSPLITEADNVSVELLEIILTNMVEPQRTTRKNAFALARDLIKRTQDTMQQYIQQFFNQVLVMEKVERAFIAGNKLYDLIYELNVIAPSMMVSVLPQLECKLKATHMDDRQKAVSLLARLFSEKDSTVARQHVPLWRLFLARFCDISVSIRVKCVQSSMHFLLNHPDLRDEIIESLRLRQHDTDESVRYEVVMAIVGTSKRDFKVVSESEDLLEYVKERTLDKKLKIRKEAMTGLAMIYKTYLIEASVPEATRKAVVWIKDKILHGYYMTGIEDKVLVERLLTTSLVPYQLPAEDRMKKLYRLLGTIDDNATKAFIELQKTQLKVRKMLFEWIKLHRIRDPSAKVQAELGTKCTAISKQLPDPLKAHEFLLKFSMHMRKDVSLLADMETILHRDVSCKDCAETMASMLKKLGQPIMTNLYYNTVKMLMERIAAVLVDRESIEILVILVAECMQGGDAIQEVGMPADMVGQRGLKMLSVLCFVFSVHFHHDSILRHMLGLLSFDEEYVAPYILKSFTYLGRFRPLSDSHPGVLEELVPICKALISSGTPKQAKHAVRCMYVNMGLPPTSSGGSSTADSPAAALIVQMFGELIDAIKQIKPEQANYRTAIVALGHIAYNLPERFQVAIKTIVSRKIVRDLLVRETLRSPMVPLAEDSALIHDDQLRAVLMERNATSGMSAWCEEDELPEETRCKVEGLKAMARWLIGLKQDVLCAQKTFRMLAAFINKGGNLLDNSNLAPAEQSWLRLSAGTAMLKVCEQKGVGDQYIAEQFYGMAQLMNDPVIEVRNRFVKKLHKGLNKGIPHKCLPLDFMGLYALAGREPDKKLYMYIKSCIETDVARRREYVRTVAGIDKASTLPHMLPDYMLVFAIAVLTHDPLFTNSQNIGQLKMIERCLWVVLEPLVSNKDYYCFGFYKNIIDRLKLHKDSLRPDDDELNRKLWAICDIALHLIYTKTTNFDTRDYPVSARIPTMYFLAQPDDFSNTDYYLPADMYSAQATAAKRLPAAAGRKAATATPVATTSEESTSSVATTTMRMDSATTKDNRGDHDNGGDHDGDDDDKVDDTNVDGDDAIDGDDNVEDNEEEEDAFREPVIKRPRIPTSNNV